MLYGQESGPPDSSGVADSGKGTMIHPSLAEIEGLARQGSVIPVHKDILGDLLTPAAAFLRVAQGRSRVFLLESVEGGERLARYSFIGWDPFLIIRGKGRWSKS